MVIYIVYIENLVYTIFRMFCLYFIVYRNKINIYFENKRIRFEMSQFWMKI